MNNITEKLEYLKDTKDLIKNTLIDLGCDMNNKSFREYANIIYNNYPKIKRVGNDLTLLNTKKAKLKIDTIINTNISIKNKNLLKLKATNNNGLTSTILEDGGLYYSGTATQTYANIIGNINNELDSGNYILSINKALNIRLTIRMYYEDNTYINVPLYPGELYKKFTLPNKIVKYYAYLSNSLVKGEYYSDTYYLQIEKTDSDTPTDFIKNEEQNILLPNNDIIPYSYNDITYIKSDNIINVSALLKGDD